ncbi:MAG: WecB/TagA/CpsF family glycosyltransferase [Burkholderiaceae bacterium]
MTDFPQTPVTQAETVETPHAANTNTSASVPSPEPAQPREPVNESHSQNNQAARTQVCVQGLPIDVLDWDEALTRIEGWAHQSESRVVSICNAHSVITAKEDTEFRQAVLQSDMSTADGTPVAWTIRRLGYPDQKRINGPDLMLLFCERAAQTGQKVFFYGNRPATLDRLTDVLTARLPGLSLAGSIAPPFRELSDEEDEDIVRQINQSGAQVVFVSLGCPKQEKWMAAHRGRIQAVMIGVGAAFDYHAGTIRRAPRWMQDIGLEWFYRLVSEPGRLWRRYLTTNTAFIVGAARQLLTKGAQQDQSPNKSD